MTADSLTSASWQPVAKDAHYKRSRAYRMTKPMLRHQTRATFVIAARGGRMGLVPTKKTRPPLRQRRYSVDVITGYQEPTGHAATERELAMLDAPAIYFEQPPLKYHETDEPLLREPDFILPDPRRFPDFNPRRFLYDVYPSNHTYFEGEKASVTNEDIWTILQRTGDHSWMRDTILDVGLELVAQRYDCERRKIAIANSMTAGLLYLPGKAGDIDENNYANYGDYEEQFRDKKYIFLPLNDGFGETNGSFTHGLHWSFLAIDRLKMTAHFVDSLLIDNYSQQFTALTVMRGVENILNESYDFTIEWNTPHQWRNNSFAGEDAGPCGPFVVKMIDLYVRHIAAYQDNGQEDNCTLDLPDDFPERFETMFSSWDVRVKLMKDIAKAKVKADSARIEALHNSHALSGLEAEVVVLDEPGAPSSPASTVIQEDPRVPEEETPDTEEKPANDTQPRNRPSSRHTYEKWSDDETVTGYETDDEDELAEIRLTPEKSRSGSPSKQAQELPRARSIGAEV
ncbi:hypothetical protein BU26DRAFT_519575 [Trematosphaeria pertusa]|uniref:Ubiquitin-like protease family profile domain-containing protein n=1 Tax=Trematosphaeria pertusa TaxID=390896 RepID=A0A6A6II10_9PLEO|nr:uncharacterized protein BU26DRAFT_519575 [Trematosphaeria pertusa]KAF2249542.1 hypothetical protein BU26DRAFT_519575 [Trematosphaeria pertusa]